MKKSQTKVRHKRVPQLTHRSTDTGQRFLELTCSSSQFSDDSFIMAEVIQAEITETETLLSNATFEGVKEALQAHLAKLRRRLLTATAPPPAPVESTAAPVASAISTSSSSSSSTRAYIPPPGVAFVPIETFSWDQGGYNSPTVTIFVELDGVGAVKESVNVNFTKTSFDLTVQGLNGRNYRLVKDNLEKDVVPEQCSFTVKKNKVVIKLQKVKGEYSYEHWTQLTGKKKREESSAAKSADPMGGIMDLMKNMYEEGDDNMRRVIGEAMLKSQRGEKVTPDSISDM